MQHVQGGACIFFPVLITVVSESLDIISMHGAARLHRLGLSDCIGRVASLKNSKSGGFIVSKHAFGGLSGAFS